MESKNLDKVKRSLVFAFAFLMLSCASQEEVRTILEDHPHFVGIWKGKGHMLNRELDKKLGEIPIVVDLKSETPKAWINDFPLTEIELLEENYGLALRGVLKGPIAPNTDFDKDRIVILLVETDVDSIPGSVCDANFHLKSNFVFDFTMAVGGVKLIKET